MTTIKGIKVHYATPGISHIMFANDSIFFLHASPANVWNFKAILYDYIEVFGQQINLKKSSLFSP